MNVKESPLAPLVTARFVKRSLVVLFLAASLTLIINQFTELDLKLADLYYDPGLKDFPWRNTWFATTVMHDWAKYLIISFGLLLFITTLSDAIYPIRKISPLARAQLRVVTLTMILAPLTVAILKHASNIHCPWSIDRYGGNQLLLKLLDWTPPGWSAGQCFPAGHASTGMWLVALAAFWLPHHPRRALLAFLGGGSVGLALGWVQQMRGAHFLTHTLATAWISSAILFALIILIARFPPLANGSLKKRKACA